MPYDFYPRSPCGERPIRICQIITIIQISIHALLAESDRLLGICQTIKPLFLSTLSLRRATAVQNTQIDKHDDFYPRSPCGERPAELTTLVNKLFISIHALLAESDICGIKVCIDNADFYPRSPCGERLHRTVNIQRPTTDFYPRSPCGERHVPV